MTLTRVGLVACCSRKLNHAAPAQDLYISPLFVLSKAYAREHCDVWAILSAKHGLLMPDRVIHPYDLSLQDFDKLERRGWARSTYLDIVARWGYDVTYVILAGNAYTRALTHGPGGALRYEAPLTGLGIGKRLAWLKAQVM